MCAAANIYTYYYQYSIIPSLFQSRLKTNPSHRSLPFLLQDWLRGFPGLFTDTSEHICFYFLVFLFYTFYLFVPLVLTHVSCRAHVKLTSRIASYRTPRRRPVTGLRAHPPINVTTIIRRPDDGHPLDLHCPRLSWYDTLAVFTSKADVSQLNLPRTDRVFGVAAEAGSNGYRHPSRPLCPLTFYYAISIPAFKRL